MKIYRDHLIIWIKRRLLPLAISFWLPQTNQQPLKESLNQLKQIFNNRQKIQINPCKLLNKLVRTKNKLMDRVQEKIIVNQTIIHLYQAIKATNPPQLTPTRQSRSLLKFKRLLLQLDRYLRNQCLFCQHHPGLQKRPSK